LTKSASATPNALLIGAVLTMLVAVNPVNTDSLAPGVPALRDYFGVSTSEANLVFSVYVFAFGFMQLVYGPIADRYGRRPVLLGALSVYCLATLLLAFAPSFDTVLLGRALQGASASAAPALARAVIRDLYGVEGSRKVMSYVMSAFGIMAIGAPAIGGVLVAWQGWQASFYFCLIYGIVTFCAVFVLLKESRPADAPTSLSLSSTFAVYVRLTPHPAFALNCVSNMLMYAAMFVWLAGSMLVIVDGYGIPPEIGGLLFACGSAGFMLGAGIAGRLGNRFSAPSLIMMGSVVGILSAALIVALSLLDVRTGLAVALPAFLWMLGHGLHYPQSMAAAVAPFPQTAGAASSLIGFYQTCAGAIAAFIMGMIHDGSALPLGGLMLGLSILALLAYAPFYRRVLRQN
jgi:DHA1 family bicyclomycin/chloramphenicol resistance-like MFS transporter